MSVHRFPARETAAAHAGASPPVVGGVGVNVATRAEALRACFARLAAGRGFCLFTLNLDHLAKLAGDDAFRRAYAGADFVTADGWPIVALARRQGGHLTRTCGSDLVDPFCAEAARCGVGAYFVGPGPMAQEKAVAILRARHSGLRVAGGETPAFGSAPRPDEVAALAARINASHARLCFLGLGAPKQEILAHALRPLCPGVGFLAVGAALDFPLGERTRAPAAVQRLGLEWAWRLLGDPRRLGARYGRAALAFAEALRASRAIAGAPR